MRVPVPFSASIAVVQTPAGGRKGFSIQNVGPVDIYYSEDQRLLDSFGNGNIPASGHILSAVAGGPLPLPVVYPFFSGKIFVRGVAAGGLADIIVYDCDAACAQAT